MAGLRFKHLFVENIVESKSTLQTVLIIFLLMQCSLTVDYRAAPIIPNETFIWAWNVPTEPCVGNVTYPLDMSFFPLVGSPRKTATKQAVTMFYTDRLGKYPYIDEKQVVIYGGVPQAVNLQEHLDKAKTDIEHYIPLNKPGLAVIDWEEWRPTWIRNWTPKDIYKNKSIELVQSQNPGMNIAQATARAKQEFEEAAKKLMKETLKLGNKLRPQYLWGFYLFPDCYNTRYQDPDYNGTCPKVEIDRNNELSWIWEESTALYPSTYLKSELKLSPKAKLYNRFRVLEGIRLSKVRGENNPLPVFLYTRGVFTDRVWEFLSINDLVNTVGEAVALGTSGVVVWDSTYMAQRVQTGCPNLHKFMRTTLNPYIINTTLAAKMCSQTLCDLQGICTRKDVHSDHYIQLNPEHLEIKLLKNGSFGIVGNPTIGDLKYFAKHFKCSCFTNMKCKERDDIENVENVKVCTANNICINTYVDPDQAFFLVPKKSLLFFTAVTHLLYHLL